MDHFMHDLAGFSEQVTRDHDLAGVTVQLLDRGAGRQGMWQILDCMIPREAPWRYREDHVFHHDPFTSIELNEHPDAAWNETVMTRQDARIVAMDGACRSYWDFLDHFGLRVEGVSTRRLRHGVYISAGYLRRADRVYRAEPRIDALNHASRRLHDMVSAEVLRKTLAGNAGHLALHNMLFAPEGEGCAGGIDLLTPRELQVARLIAAGRQTKQAAYELGLSKNTIDNHLRRIYAKLSVHNRAGLASLLH